MAILSTDPLGLLLGPDGDLVVDAGGGYLVRGLEGVRQDLEIALRMFRGEWFLNLDEGPAWDRVLGERLDEQLAQDIVRGVVAGRPHVLAILELRVGFDGALRRLSIYFRVKTSFGDLEHTVEA